jgi:hypothetical protein
MWGGSDVWVRGQGEAIGKAVWYHSRWSSASKITIEWDGMTADEKEENRVWCDAFIEESNKPSEKGKDTDVEGSDTMDMQDHITKMEEQLDAERRKCRGGCGAENVNNVCSRCKEVCKSPPFIFLYLSPMSHSRLLWAGMPKGRLEGMVFSFLQRFAIDIDIHSVA